MQKMNSPLVNNWCLTRDSRCLCQQRLACKRKPDVKEWIFESVDAADALPDHVVFNITSNLANNNKNMANTFRYNRYIETTKYPLQVIPRINESKGFFLRLPVWKLNSMKRNKTNVPLKPGAQRSYRVNYINIFIFRPLTEWAHKTEFLHFHWNGCLLVRQLLIWLLYVHVYDGIKMQGYRAALDLGGTYNNEL